MSSINDLLRQEQAKSQQHPVCGNATSSERANLQRILNATNSNQLSSTVNSFITDSMIANKAHGNQIF